MRVVMAMSRLPQQRIEKLTAAFIAHFQKLSHLLREARVALVERHVTELRDLERAVLESR